MSFQSMDKFQLWILEAHVKQEVWALPSDRDLIWIWWQEASCGRCVIVCVEMTMFFSSFCPAPGPQERDFLPGNRSLGVELRSPGTAIPGRPPCSAGNDCFWDLCSLRQSFLSTYSVWGQVLPAIPLDTCVDRGRAGWECL